MLWRLRYRLILRGLVEMFLLRGFVSVLHRSADQVHCKRGYRTLLRAA